MDGNNLDKKIFRLENTIFFHCILIKSLFFLFDLYMIDYKFCEGEVFT